MQVDLSGKVAIVTGGARDIGAAVVRALAQSGASVVVNYQSSAEHANALVADVTANGGKAIAVQADVTKPDQVQRLVAETRAAFGETIDILVNNAGGIIQRRKLDEMDGAFWDAVFALNTKSTFLVTQAVAPLMTNGGAIVNMASLAARDGGGGGAIAYSASKGAVLTMTRGLDRKSVVEGKRVE